MREAARRGNPEAIQAEIDELKKQTHRGPHIAKYQEKIEDLERQLEDLLVNYDHANNDQTNLSHALENRLEVDVNLGSLASVQNRNERPTLSHSDLELSDENYLLRQRCRAEANLIKSRIAYKVFSMN